MGNRPKKEYRPLLGYVGDYEQKVRTIDLIKKIVSDAIKLKGWVFEPDTKRWFSPEEFLSMYERYDNLDPKWLERIQILDPIEGLDAADKQIESIIIRKAILSKRIIEYERRKK